LDDQLVERLRAEYGHHDHVDIIHADFLDVTLEQVTPVPASLKVIGNIPYNITTPILFALLERRPRPREIVLMVQREVADRILAPPGSKTYGALAVGVQTVATAERVLNVGRKAFRPVPEVESAVIRIVPHAPPPLSEAEEKAVRNLTRAAFGQRRKQFQRILRDAYHLTPQGIASLEQATGLDLQARPETLAPARFIDLARALAPAQNEQ
jgi:16S rRNA (adenine1518-N6/adenine1519-N6)-dimethyltransferase